MTKKFTLLGLITFSSMKKIKFYDEGVGFLFLVSKPGVRSFNHAIYLI
jgi:hypothetical protein